jgi:MoaA/NifB/PqqE/SkfB family radical SAM enzyme
MLKHKKKIKTGKKNRVVIEEINQNELKEIWDKLPELNDLF